MYACIVITRQLLLCGNCGPQPTHHANSCCCGNCAPQPTHHANSCYVATVLPSLPTTRILEQAKHFVALKVVKSASHYTETALDEIKLLKCVIVYECGEWSCHKAAKARSSVNISFVTVSKRNKRKCLSEQSESNEEQTMVRESDASDPKRDKTVQLLDDFKISGVNGTHVCMVFEVLGHNLLKLIVRSNYQGIPLPNVKCIIRQVSRRDSDTQFAPTRISVQHNLTSDWRQNPSIVRLKGRSEMSNKAPNNVLEGLDYLHTKCKIIHTDIKPENILLCVEESYVRKLATEAAQWRKMGLKLPCSLVSAAPRDPGTLELRSKVFKSKKRKSNKKSKRQDRPLEENIKPFQELNDSKHESDISVVPVDLVKLQESENDSSSDAASVDELDLAEDVTPDTNNLTSNVLLTNKTSVHLTDNVFNDTEQKHVKNTTEESITKSQIYVENRKSFAEMEQADIHHPQQLTVNFCNGQHSGPSEGKMEETQESQRHVLGRSESQAISHINSASHKYNHNENKPFRRVASCPDAQRLVKALDPVLDVCDIKVKIADLGNSCWSVSVQRWESKAVQACVYSKLHKNKGRGTTHTRAHDWVYQTLGDVLRIDLLACFITRNCALKKMCVNMYLSLNPSFTILVSTVDSTALGINSSYNLFQAFELATGDYLFEPHSGEDYSRDEDHLAHIIELLGTIPKHLIFSGKYSREYFNKKGDVNRHLTLNGQRDLQSIIIGGAKIQAQCYSVLDATDIVCLQGSASLPPSSELRHITKLKPWRLREVLTEKYEWNNADAKAFADFLTPMLAFELSERVTAQECLKHPWLSS
uniref:non-specific serine/threonine protein kinase n=1 Tax=Timema cristinae TaxID=61476 RepID=A0A7R9GVR3_TIMCR|nr:unnamed protein product [Timema cristinae]